jgi:hypothetical protein
VRFWHEIDGAGHEYTLGRKGLGGPEMMDNILEMMHPDGLSKRIMVQAELQHW